MIFYQYNNLLGISKQNKSRILCQTIDILSECVIVVSEMRIKRLQEDLTWTIERWRNE